MRMASVQSAYANTHKGSRLILKYVALLSLLCFPANVYAQDAIGQAMCNVVMLMAGTTGKAICTINIIALGVGALLGKISWSKTMCCLVGVGLIFGSASVVSELSYNSNPLFSSSDLGGGGSGRSGGDDNGVTTTLVGPGCVADGSLVSE